MIVFKKQHKDGESSKAKGVSLKVSIFSITLLAALLPLSLYGYVSYTETTKQVTSSIQDSLLKSNQSNAKLVKYWIDGNDAAVRAVATSQVLAELDPERSRQHLASVGEQLKTFYAIMNIDKTGLQIARSNNDKMINVGDREYFKKPMDGASSYIQSAFSRTNGKAFVAFSAPLKVNNDTVGVLAALANIDQVTEQVTGGHIGKTGISYLVDVATGTMLAHPNKKFLGEKLSSGDAKKADAGVFGKIIDGLNTQNNPVKITSSAVGANLVLVSEIDSEEINKPIRDAQKSAIEFMAGALLLSGLLSYLLARSISNKIHTLARVVTNISKAKNVTEISALEKKIDDVGGARELRQIAEAIRRLTASIKMAMRSL